jgi:hypothetical protein
MSYKRREPVSEKEMLKDRYEGHHTVCQTLRDIYALTENEDIKYKCRLAMAMCKAMHKRLKKYKKMFDEQNESQKE